MDGRGGGGGGVELIKKGVTFGYFLEQDSFDILPVQSYQNCQIVIYYLFNLALCPYWHGKN